MPIARSGYVHAPELDPGHELAKARPTWLFAPRTSQAGTRKPSNTSSVGVDALVAELAQRVDRQSLQARVLRVLPDDEAVHARVGEGWRRCRSRQQHHQPGAQSFGDPIFCPLTT